MVDVGAIEKIAPAVHVIPDQRVEFVPNVGIVEGDRAVLVVDTAMGHANGHSILEVATGIADGRKVILTTTHFHPEHAFGAKPFERAATYVMNKGQASELADKGTEYVEMFSGFGPGLAQLLTDIELIPPDLTYEGRLRIDLGGTAVELLDVGPAHTRGDQLIWLPAERIVFAGDLIENAFFPILPDGDADGTLWLAVLDRLTELGPAVVVGGHGAIGGGELIEAFRGYFELIRARTSQLCGGGADTASAVATIEAEMIGEHPDWGNQVWIKSAVENAASGLAS